MKKAVCILLLASVLFVLFAAGCSLKDKEGQNGADNTEVNIDEVDPTTPILTIGDQKITFAIYKALYESYLPYMQSTGYDPLDSKDSLESFQDWLVDSLSKDLVILHQAETNGFTLTEDQERELEEQTAGEIQELYDTYYGYAEKDYEDDPTITVETYFENYIASMSKYYTGVEMNWEDYQKEYSNEARRSFIIQSYKDSVCEEFTPSNQDVTDWYDTRYNSNKSSYTDYPSKYKTDEEYYEMYYGEKDDAFPVLYVPSGYSRVMHIVITPAGELSEQYENDMKRIDEIKAEFADLAFEDAVSGEQTHDEQIAALIAEYNTLKASTDAEYMSYSAAARDKIGKAYAALRSGQPFAKVMEDYTEDPRIVGDNNYNGCAAFREKGELISLEYTSNNDWSETVKAEFEKLSVGEYSEVFRDGDSYHIIYYVGDETPGDVELGKVYSEISALCAQSVRDSQWDAIVEEWLRDPELVRNESLIRSLGLADVKKGA